MGPTLGRQTRKRMDAVPMARAQADVYTWTTRLNLRMAQVQKVVTAYEYVGTDSVSTLDEARPNFWNMYYR